MLLIPSIDLRAGRCVRLLQGDFSAETRYELEPHELLARYRQLGASWLHVVDLDAARDGALINRNLIHRLAAQRAVRLQVGGGVRDAAAIEQLLAHGVARVVIGSAAVEQPGMVAAWLERYGVERLCLAFDVRHDEHGIPRVRTRGWQRDSALSLWDAVGGYGGSGLRHVLCTDIERDGALAGPNLALYEQALARFPGIAWQASGGIAGGADLAALAERGLPAAISGKALLEERITREELRAFLPNA
ncbi:MAG TPA: 1-(5-phosphoribosyl)-5-[(5-phosphoribosylamino)methylideneamino] imidazole-4-carboxamide isomerase [Steroidobacteraceae bacterium]|nr:1-(5-phosphoribosyl)-5-[(5-phosphoribosylamino)methylideneamino] imidazole-4-carboxamide isomerase [Steroidobacteraceae bacterium]